MKNVNNNPDWAPPVPGGGPRIRPYKTRPHIWVSGPDPVRHAQYTAWMRCRAQAHFRGEEWQLTFEQYVRVWGDNWHRRGRQGTSLQACRIRRDRPWKLNNIELRTRADMNRLEHQKRTHR